MIRFLKVSVSLLALLAVGGAILGYQTYQRQLALTDELATQRAGATAVADALELDLDGWQAALTDSQQSKRALQQLATLAEQTMQARDAARTDHAAALEQFRNTEREKALIASELDAARDDAEALTKTLAETREQLASTQNRTRQLDQQITSLEQSIDTLEHTLATNEDELIEIREERDGWRDIALEGTSGPDIWNQEAAQKAVVIKSRPDMGFIVLDKGDGDRLEPGMHALVHRGEELIGRVRLTRTRAKQSIAEIQPDWGLSEIRAGDQLAMEHAFRR